MSCLNCNNDLMAGAKFCGKCGSKVSNETAEVIQIVKNKTVRGGRTALGLFIALIVFAITGKVLMFIIAIIVSLGLSALDINGPSNFANAEAVGNILGFVIAVYLGNKVYKKITKGNNNTAK